MEASGFAWRGGRGGMLGVGCGPAPPPEPTPSPAMDAALPLPTPPSPCSCLWLRTCRRQSPKSASGTDTRPADATAHHGAQPVHAAAHWRPCSPPPPLPPLTAHLQPVGWTPPGPQTPPPRSNSLQFPAADSFPAPSFPNPKTPAAWGWLLTQVMAQLEGHVPGREVGGAGQREEREQQALEVGGAGRREQRAQPWWQADPAPPCAAGSGSGRR
ncbi:uncharacterized protein [Manis javanica]|uniref:uncharacterized protein n=1 Tax=Manis javanica TaxID=9974 RepID=UPI003C6DB567